MEHLSQETAADADEVEALYDLSFAPGRTALSSYRLRDGSAPVAELSLIMRDDYWVIVGAIRYWPIMIRRPGENADADAEAQPSSPRSWPALLLGPVAVHPTRQGEGIGALLIQRSLETAAKIGWERVILIGDAPYYRRFGFSRGAAAGVTFPPPTNPDRILARALRPGAMDGVAGEATRAAAPDRRDQAAAASVKHSANKR